MTDPDELSELVVSLSPQELYDHAELSNVYKAASAIAISSYNGSISTSPVGALRDKDVELIHRLLNRFADSRGYIEFPVMPLGTVEEIVVSASRVASYSLRRRKNPQTEEEVTYFSSFPAST